MVRRGRVADCDRSIHEDDFKSQSPNKDNLSPAGPLLGSRRYRHTLS